MSEVTVSDEVLRSWILTEEQWGGDPPLSFDARYVARAARELLELREKVKQYEERGSLQSKCECCGELLRDHEDEPGRDWHYDVAGEVQLCIECIEASGWFHTTPPPGPDREPEGPTGEEPEPEKKSKDDEARRRYHAEHIVKPMLEDYSKAIEALDAHDSLSIVPFIEELKARATRTESSDAAARAERMTEWATIAFRAEMESEDGSVCCDISAESAWVHARTMEREREKALRGDRARLSTAARLKHELSRNAERVLERLSRPGVDRWTRENLSDSLDIDSDEFDRVIWELAAGAVPLIFCRKDRGWEFTRAGQEAKSVLGYPIQDGEGNRV